MIESTNTRTWPGSAAEWFAARHGAHDAELERRFERWLTEDPRNGDEYALCDITWELSADPAASLAAPVPLRRWPRRAAAALLALAACAALVAVLVPRLAPPAPLRFVTAPGEQRSIRLADGSEVTLNTRSALEVRIGRAQRELHMLEGEAFFAVAKDAARPFVVETPLGRARAVGTRFNVFVLDDRVEVSTEEGRVLVQSGDRDGDSVMTTPGTRATLERGMQSPRVDAADLTRIENWRAQRLEFDRVRLDDALAEISRYTALPIRAGSAEIGRTEISAVLKVGDVAALAATLEGAFGLELVETRDEWIVKEPATGGEGAEPPSR
jgi:transmembrane sensor